MKRLIVAVLAASSLVAVAAPALAQYGPPPFPANTGPPQVGPGAPAAWDISQRIDWIQGRINRARADGSLDKREADRAQKQLISVSTEERKESDRNFGHLSDGDRATIQTQLDSLLGELHWMHENNERRPW